MRHPVCPLEKALYGRPDAGGYWEQHCDSHLRDCGFLPVAAEDKAWRGYWNPSLSCYAIVYVDDFKISGPEKNAKKAWELIRAENARTGKPGIVLDNPTPAGEFLGCGHVVSEDWGPPMSKDRTPMTKLPREEEYNNYHAGAPPAAQTTKPDATTCATNYQGWRDDDKANYHAGAPPAAQTTKTDAAKCATNYLGGRVDDKANYHVGAPPAAQTTKPDTMKCAADEQGGHDNDKADHHAGAPPDGQTAKLSIDGIAEDTTRGAKGIPRYDENRKLAPPGCILRKRIKYDMSDFLGSRVRLCQDLTNTGNVPLKPAITPFIDEIGDDYGLGTGEAENGPGAHDYVDMERTLQEFAQNVCVGLERSGYDV
jgi:hypothetical protein